MAQSTGGQTHFTKGWKIDSSAVQNGVCPACGSTDRIKVKGALKLRKGKFGSFLGCSKYPDCKYTKNIK
jgi:ssDNA-binding Zn-finger/Zn-ribbon topoisomerase 1